VHVYVQNKGLLIRVKRFLLIAYRLATIHP